MTAGTDHLGQYYYFGFSLTCLFSGDHSRLR